jgi:drug/metabolite transporter (DMT)-like permease
MSPAALFFSCVAIWGTTWIAVTFQVAATAPEFGVALRFTLAALVLLAWCAWRGIDLALDRATHLRLALLGALGFCLSYLFVYHALHYIVSGLVAVGYSAIPLVNMVLARMFFGTPMSRRVGLGGTLGLAGIALIFWPEFGRLAADRPLVLGALLTAAGVLASALANMLMTSVQRRGVSGWGPLALGMTYGAAASWLVVLAAGVPTAIRWSWGFGLSLAYLVLAGSVLAFGAYYALLARVGAARAAKPALSQAGAGRAGQRASTAARLAFLALDLLVDPATHPGAHDHHADDDRQRQQPDRRGEQFPQCIHGSSVQACVRAASSALRSA